MTFNRTLCVGCPFDGVYEPLESRGPEDARFLVVTDVPSMASARDDRLMTKHQMEMLGKKIDAVGLARTDFRFTPACHCAYDPNEHVTKEKTAAHKHCRQHFLAEVESRKYEVVVPLGAVAATQTLGRPAKITKVRGLVTHSEELGLPIFPLMSPGLVVMYPQNEPVFTADVESLARAVNAEYDVALAASQQVGKYTIVDDLQFLIDLDPEIVAFDTENTGLRWYQSGVDVRSYKPEFHKRQSFFRPKFQILTMQFTTAAGEGYMLVWDHPENPVAESKKPKLRNQLRQLLCAEGRIVVGQNTKYDSVALWKTEGIRFRVGGDTLMLATLLDENLPEKNLDILTKIYVPEMSGYADLFNSQYDKSRMWEVPLSKLVNYGCGDADAVYRLYHRLEEEVANDELLWAHYCRVTLPGLNAFAALETRGMYIDEGEALADFKATMVEDVSRMESELLHAIPRACKQDIVAKYLGKVGTKNQLVNKGKTASDALSFTRTDFVKEVLFSHPLGFRLKPQVFTKTTSKLNDESLREPSVSAKDHLPYFFDTCPFTMQLAEYQKDRHLLNTNVVKFEENYIRGGKVRPNYHLHKVVTGRSACVKGDTPIVTRLGVVHASDVAIGDEVWTHTGRWMPVSRLYRKPATQMYRLTFTDGQTLTATGAHRLLLESGEWVEIDFIIRGDHERQQSGYGKCRAVRRGRGGVSDAADHREGSRGRVWNQPGHRTGDDSTAYIGQGLRYAESDSVQTEQAGGEEPTVRQFSSIRLRGCGRVHDTPDQWQAVPSAPDCDVGANGHTPLGVSGCDDRAPHRREQEKQRPRQSCNHDTQGTRENSRTVPIAGRGLGVEKIEPAGVHRVYDFEVDEDHSYFACGVFSHNSDDPNGQNYPKRGARAKAYRKMFKPPPGYYVIEVDLSQAELRIAACMSGDKTMIEIYRQAGDIHKATALIVAGLSLAQFEVLPRKEQKELRQKAKAVNFGFLYGMGWRKFIGYAKTQYGVTFTEKEAQRIRKEFFAKYRSLARWHEVMREFAKEHKFVRSFSGRIRHLPMIDSPEDFIQQEAGRQAINSPVQEFGSSLGVMALGRIDEEVDPEALQVVGFIHDAVVAYVKCEYLDWGMRTLKEYMQTNPVHEWFGVNLKVPIVADVGFGLNLGEVIECEGFSLDKPFDYSSLTDKDGTLLIEVPPQLTPPNNGRLTRSAFTTVDDLEDESIFIAPRRTRLMRPSVTKETVKRMERSSRQMVINKRNEAIRKEEERLIRAGKVIRRSRPTAVS